MYQFRLLMKLGRSPFGCDNRSLYVLRETYADTHGGAREIDQVRHSLLARRAFILTNLLD